MVSVPGAAEPPPAEPREEGHSGQQQDPPDPEHPEDGGVRTDEGVDQQEAQREEDEEDPDPCAAAAHADAEPTTAVATPPARGAIRAGSAVAGSTGDRDALAPLRLGEAADLLAVVERVLARIDASRPKFPGRGAEDRGEVGAHPLLAALRAVAVLADRGAVGRDWVDAESLPLPSRCPDACRCNGMWVRYP